MRLFEEGELFMDSTQDMLDIEYERPSTVKRVFLVLLVTLAILFGTVYTAGYILIKGPSAYAGEQFVQMVGENPVAQVVLRLYLTDAEQADIRSAQSQGTQRFSVELDVQ